MPQPGSHSYDVQRAHKRKDYENSGVPDEKANERANEDLQQSGNAQENAPTDRAYGPKGERSSS